MSIHEEIDSIAIAETLAGNYVNFNNDPEYYYFLVLPHTNKLKVIDIIIYKDSVVLCCVPDKISKDKITDFLASLPIELTFNFEQIIYHKYKINLNSPEDVADFYKKFKEYIKLES